MFATKPQSLRHPTHGPGLSIFGFFLLGRRVEGQLHTPVFHPPHRSLRGLFEPGVQVGEGCVCACKRINSAIGLDASLTICAYNHVTLEIAHPPTDHHATTGHQCQFV